MKTQSARSLTATLAIAFFILSALALLVSGSLQLVSSLQTQQETIADKQFLLAQSAAETVSSFVQEKFGVLEAAVSLATPAAVSPEAQKRALNSLLGLQPAFERLALLDTQNQEVAQVTRFAQSSQQFTAQINDALLVQTQQGERYISSVYIDDRTSEPMVAMAVPVTDALGDFQGTLVAEVNLKFMWILMDQLRVGETGWAYVVDKNGDLIAYRDASRVLKGENLSGVQAVGDFIKSPAPIGETGTSTYQGLTDTVVVGTYVPLGTPQWAVVTELPWQEAYGGVIQSAVTSIGVILVIAILAGLGGTFVARRLAIPLVNLTNTASRIAAGELTLAAEVQGPQEVANLATAFNSMSSSLQEMISKETSSRVVLETTVDHYLGFVEQVAQGNLAQRLDLGPDTSPEAKNAPLYVLGTNLNHMVNSLAEMTDRNAQLLAETQRAREAAEEANRVKSQFLASMSHELRTPLNAILNFSEMMSLGMVGPVTEQQVDVLNKSLDSGRHLLSLINDVLDITKIQSGTLTLFVEDDLGLQTILESVSHTAETLLKDKPVRFVKNIDGNLPVIAGDKRRIRQVLLNLISNAAKFTEEGTIALSVRRENDEILFVVSDTGPGISKDQQGIVFEPFIQTSTGIQHAGGTGLGLPISKSFVEAHGGRLWLKSEPGKGAAFYFTLPVHAAVAASVRN
ncbi:MAG: HAMP domain-containing protein [Anaerolineae bacterium]|nr:HAMP domain-containing protein [Anaerolineae bacterium]